MEYQITKEECEGTAGDRVCPQCGKPVTAIETVNNSGTPTHWLGCEDCCRFDMGVTPNVYEIAVMMVDQGGYHHCAPEIPLNERNDEAKKHWRHKKIGHAAEVVRQVLFCQRGIDENQKLIS